MKLLRFLKKPFYNQSYYNNKISFLLIFTFINIFINAFAIILLDSNEIEPENIIEKLSIIEQFFLIGILFPIIEELVFRYPLKLNTKNIDAIFLLTIPISIILFFSSNLLLLGILTLTSILLYAFFRKKIQDYLIKNSANVIIFYGLALLFSLCHIDNYSSDPTYIVIIFIILAFISGVLFSVVRMLIGFKYAVWSHIIYNCFFITLNFLYPI